MSSIFDIISNNIICIDNVLFTFQISDYGVLCLSTYFIITVLNIIFIGIMLNLSIIYILSIFVPIMHIQITIYTIIMYITKIIKLCK